MSEGPQVVNEPVRAYAPGSPERLSLERRLASLAAERTDLPMVIGGRDLRTDRTSPCVMPHAHSHELGRAHLGGATQVAKAIEVARAVAPAWSRTPWTERAAVFLRAADLLAGPWREDRKSTRLNSSHSQ